MKAIATLVGIGVFTHATVLKREFQDVVNDFAQIQAHTVDLDNAIKGYTSASQASGLINESNTIITSINKGISDANAAAPFTVTDSATLISPVRSLAATVSTTIHDLISQKDILVSTCLGPVTYKSLLQQQSAATQFANVLSAKVPPSLQSTAQQLSSAIANSFAQGVKAFSNAQQLPKSCSGSSSDSSSRTRFADTSFTPPVHTSSTPVVLTSFTHPGHTTSTGPSSFPSPTGGHSLYTGAALRNHLSAAAVIVLIPLAILI